MIRRSLLLALLPATLLATAAPAVAGGGGGCLAGVTDGTGDTVEMVQACFTPTILQVQPGDPVTFVNRDGWAHNVSGNMWGHFDALDRGDAFTTTFADAGIYPYACTFHLGMTGAVVVGWGSDDGDAVTARPFEDPPMPSPLVEVRTVTGADAVPVAVGWIAGGAIGLAVGGAIAILARRRHPDGRSARPA